MSEREFAEELRRLRELLRSRSLRTGNFTLASGAHSDYYIDARLTTMAGTGQLLLGRVGLATIDERGWKAELVGGLTLGADPIAYAIAHAAALENRAIDGFTVRKEAKQHGTGRVIEGPFREGARVVVVEDVITRGESALRACRAVKEAGGDILGVLAVVDREEGGRAVIEAEGYKVAALYTASELVFATG
jgi:orotate phosphoribosyltransferase